MMKEHFSFLVEKKKGIARHNHPKREKEKKKFHPKYNTLEYLDTEASFTYSSTSLGEPQIWGRL